MMTPRMPSHPLLSLLIPTKNRYETLLPVLSAITGSICDDALEVVICDNSSVPLPWEVRALIERDNRVIYHHTSAPLSIVDNTELGIGLCRGDYLCFIGDDDLASPYIVNIARWMAERAAEALIFPPARYWWASVDFAAPTRFLHPGAFWLPTSRDSKISVRNSVNELGHVRAKGGVTYANLPRLYHGVVSRRALDRVHATFGRMVPGSSPDMALSMALALTTSEYLAIDYPVTVFGASRNSGGGLTAARRHYGRIEDQVMLPDNILDNWDSRLPRIWSEQVIYPQTIHEVTSQLGRPTGLDYPALYASLIAYEPHIIPYLWPILRERLAQNPTDLVPIMTQIIMKIFGRLRTTWRSRTGVGLPFDLHHLPDVAAVTSFMAALPPPNLVRL